MLADVNTLESITLGDDSSAYGDETIYGTTVGGGLRFTPWFFVVKLDYAKTHYDTITLSSTTGNKNKISADF